MSPIHPKHLAIAMLVWSSIGLALVAFAMCVSGCYHAHCEGWAEEQEAKARVKAREEHQRSPNGAAGSYNVAPGSPAYWDSGYPIEVAE